MTTSPTTPLTTRLESTAPQWDEQRDGAFFRIVQGLFPDSTLLAATVLLESYDDDLANSTRDGLVGATLAR